MALLQCFDELGNIRTHAFFVDSIVTANFVCDAALVITPLHQIKDSCSDNVETEHLTVLNIEQNSPVRCFRPPDCVGDSQHIRSLLKPIESEAIRMQGTLAPTASEIQTHGVLFLSGQFMPPTCCKY